ncbi:carbohydrate-binding family 9-like protein [Pontibacillus sp. HMF3514]|uniref:carbohydrate-binding family 9-like protein n=1 Tax=Pontibacillus sp. HMF3514 TaxID=2692425 RepID=UPI00131F4BC4|nr:carbohydrate-binding family 9-like protein [Pontibacillus sp. HMF3514]QHE53039.1 hypothetical protein GS400_13865 [Pontibacillus sp. HMF3514]
MKKEYALKYVHHYNEKLLNSLEKLTINDFPWNEQSGPVTEVRLCYTCSHLHIHFTTYETKPRSTYTQHNDPVYKDSCVEFFIKPKPSEDDRYVNIEVNSLGTCLIGMGISRTQRTRLNQEMCESISITPQLEPECWKIDITIPFSFFEQYFRDLKIEKGAQMEGNFYKCGDETKNPHFGCWNRIENKNPDFHLPSYFGVLHFN